MKVRRPVVAVVDDDPRLLESLDDLLESAGYLPRGFSSARSFLAMGVSDVDLLITDIGMPDIDGLELHDLVKKARPDLPVFLITGRHELAEQNRSRKGDIFCKPFDSRVLLAAIEDALGKQNKEDGNAS